MKFLRPSVIVLICVVSMLSGCGGGKGSTTVNKTTPAITWNTPAAVSLGTALSSTQLNATASSGGTSVAGTFVYSPVAGTVMNTAGAQTLSVTFTPTDSADYNAATGSVTLTVNAAALVTPTVTVTPASSSISTALSLSVTVAVSGTNGTPTGSVVLSSGSYISATATLSSGSASITIPAGKLAAGSDTLTAKYTPDSGSSATYTSASGTAPVTVTAVSGTAVTVNIDALTNRHSISQFVYGGNTWTPSASTITDSGTTLLRWGGNDSSNYNWQLQTRNSVADWYFEDYGGAGDSVGMITSVQNAGSHALMTMPMMGWVAGEAENSTNRNWSYSVAIYGAQCAVDPSNADAGNGQKTDCSTPVTTNAVTTAYYPLLDSSSQACPTGNCVYREPWAQALAAAFGSGTCAVPYSPITTCHFYDMDNESDIWGGTHRDVHPVASGYDELANLYESEAGALKTWDPAAVRFGPVSCCWWFYWNVGPSGDDKTAHGGVDFLPWWLNQIYWLDQIHGARTLDVFDIHAYPDANTSSLTTAQLQALSADIYRDYWDPTYVSTSGTVNQIWTTSIQPNYSIPFRIPRMKAMVNAIYPGTPLSFTEWSAAFYQESDFSTALGDADAYGIFGREGLSFATRWGGPTSGNPNYQALKMYTNYDGAHGGFGTVSVADTNTGNVNLFSSYAALNSAGTVMTIMVLNKDPEQFGAGHIQPVRIQRVHLRGLHAGHDRFRRDFGLQFGGLERIAELRAVQHHSAGDQRKRSIQTRIGVVPQPRRPDDSRFGHRNPASGDQQRQRRSNALLGCLRRLRGRSGMQRLAGAHQLHHHCDPARKHHRQRGQHSWLLPLYRDGQRRHGNPDAGRLDRRRQPRRHACPVGQ
jgi:hypothetical protein